MSLKGNQWKPSVGQGATDRFVLPLRGNGDWIAKFRGAGFPELARLERATMSAPTPGNPAQANDPERHPDGLISRIQKQQPKGIPRTR